jgi:hypothetical protein
VLRVDPRHAVVYRSIRHPRRGSPIDITDPQAPQRAEQQLRETGTYIDFTWALVLNELPGHRTRLLVHTRANYSPRASGSSPCRWACSTPPTEWRSCGRSPGARKTPSRRDHSPSAGSRLRGDPGAQVAELAGLHDEVHRFPHQQAEWRVTSRGRPRLRVRITSRVRPPGAGRR